MPRGDQAHTRSRLISFTKGWLGLKALIVLCRAAYTDDGALEPPFVGEGIYAETKASSLRDGLSVAMMKIVL
jgi:hypothetical protein